MLDSSSVVVKSSIVANDAENLLREVAFSNYLRLRGWNAELAIERRFIVAENDVVNGIGIRLNFGEYVPPQEVEEACPSDNFQEFYFTPLLADVHNPQFHPIKAEIRAAQSELQQLALEFDESIGNTVDLEQTPLFKQSRALVNFIEEIIEVRLQTDKGAQVIRNLADL